MHASNAPGKLLLDDYTAFALTRYDYRYRGANREFRAVSPQGQMPRIYARDAIIRHELYETIRRIVSPIVSQIVYRVYNVPHEGDKIHDPM